MDCSEKYAVHAGMLSAFGLAIKWLPTLHPGCLTRAVSEQASAKEGGWSLVLLTPEGACFAHLGGVLRVTKVIGTMCGFAEELAWTYCRVKVDLSTTGLCQLWQEPFGLLECWLCAPVKQAATGQKAHHLLYGFWMQCACVCVRMRWLVLSVLWYVVFSGHILPLVKYKEQYWAVWNPEQWWLPFVNERFNTVWASVLYVGMHKYEL